MIETLVETTQIVPFHKIRPLFFSHSLNIQTSKSLIQNRFETSMTICDKNFIV